MFGIGGGYILQVNQFSPKVKVINPLGLLVEDVKVYLNHFQRMLSSHVKRNSNSVAYCLAKHAISIPSLQVWMKDLPSHIVSFLDSDLTYLH